ncbi:MAG: hypothetical protein K0S33_3713 [Bacteroidetes bacterium]|jgi:hypothetical protein|nr:hypothetical protein [Bacteroidota bacterium]
MKKLILILFLTSTLFSCVKDPMEASESDVFTVQIAGVDITNAVIYADNSLRYQIDISIKDIEVDNDKQVTVSVTDGIVSSSSNLTAGANSNLATLSIQGGKATCYYKPGKKAQNAAVLSLTINGLTQIFNFKILPSEPVQILLSATPQLAAVNAPINLTASLIKDSNTNSYVSDNLKVTFEVTPFSALDTVEGFLPDPSWSYSALDEATQFVTAKKTFTTNQKKGKLNAIARYQKADGTSLSSNIVTITFN